MRAKTRLAGLAGVVVGVLVTAVAAPAQGAVLGVLMVANRTLDTVVDVYVDGVRVIDDLAPGASLPQAIEVGGSHPVAFVDGAAPDGLEPLYGGPTFVTLEVGQPQTLVAHLSASGVEKATLFADPLGPVEPEHGLVTLRHVADTGPLDLWVDGVRYPIALTNGHQMTVAVPAWELEDQDIAIVPAGAPLSGDILTLSDVGMREGVSWTLHFWGGSGTYGADGGSVAIEVRTVFSDIAGSAFETEIQWMADEEISRGWSNGDGTAQYRPYGQVTRDAMAAFLYRFAGKPKILLPAESPFVDVSPTQPFYGEICWLASTGISTGWDVPGGKEFRPYAPITRDAMAAFLYRYVGAVPDPFDGDAPFVDVSPATSEFSDEIEWLASEGISTGWDVGEGAKEFRPFAHITRDAMAAFLYRLRMLPS